MLSCHVRGAALLGLVATLVGCAAWDGPAPVGPTQAIPPLSTSVARDRGDGAQRVAPVRLAAFEQAELEPSAAAAPRSLRSVEASEPRPGELLQPRSIRQVLYPTAAVEQAATQPAVIELDLTRALAMAGGQNPQIMLAAARYREAYARLKAAHALWLPSIRVGVSYNHHDGNLQASPGEVLRASRSSWQGGLGVQAVGAGTPAVPGIVAQFQTADAVFQPRIEAYAASARQAATRSTSNDTLLETALAYLELLRAYQLLEITEETREHAQQLADVTTAYAQSGEGAQADADRLQTELALRRNEVVRAQEATQVAAARLAELLRLDPAAQIVPQETAIAPIDLVAPETPVAELLATGLSHRPELAEAQYLVCEAVHRYRREKFAPLLPSVLLAISQSGFGGGRGSDLGDTSGRFDVDATVFWEIRNLGFGESARRMETRAVYDQTRARQLGLMDRVAREVVEASQQARTRATQIPLAESAVAHATDSYERNRARMREGQGLPIEVLQSVQALDESRRDYLRSLSDYNEAQFRLHCALGWAVR